MNWLRPEQLTLWRWELDAAADLWIDGTTRACRWCFEPFGLAPTRDAERFIFRVDERPNWYWACPNCDGMQVSY